MDGEVRSHVSIFMVRVTSADNSWRIGLRRHAQGDLVVKLRRFGALERVRPKLLKVLVLGCVMDAVTVGVLLLHHVLNSLLLADLAEQLADLVNLRLERRLLPLLCFLNQFECL